jgi:ferredoxin
MAVRHIVRIDEELCNGCGVCVTPCAEGAIVLVDGKRQVTNLPYSALGSFENQRQVQKLVR